MKKPFITKESPNILIVGLMTPYNRMLNESYYFNEFLALVNTNFIDPVATYFTKLRSIDAAFFLTKGKLEDIKKLCQENDIDEVIISEVLTPNQERNLEKELGVTVFDRTHLILEIFEKQAQTKEAKLQVHMAFLEHKKTRVAGMGSHFSQQAGRFGIISGAGETQKELDLRHIDHLMLRIRKEINELNQHKITQSKQRKRNNVFEIGLVGYTNAGKSTLFNMLTKSNVLAKDKLFATLDTTTRTMFLEGAERKITMNDTIGFIQNIPHQLIASFHSTLSQIHEVNLILHVINTAHPDYKNQYHTVMKTLEEIGSFDDGITIIDVYNQMDLLPHETKEVCESYVVDHSRKHVFISSLDRFGIDDLLQTILEIITIDMK